MLSLLCGPASASSTRATYIGHLSQGRQTDIMAFWVYSGGHDMQSRINLDSLGQLYLIFAAVWTVLLLISIARICPSGLPFIKQATRNYNTLQACSCKSPVPGRFAARQKRPSTSRLAQAHEQNGALTTLCQAITCILCSITAQVHLSSLLMMRTLTSLQIMCMLLTFCLSRRFHASWSVLGNKADTVTCRKGWE